MCPVWMHEMIGGHCRPEVKMEKAAAFESKEGFMWIESEAENKLWLNLLHVPPLNSSCGGKKTIWAKMDKNSFLYEGHK